MPLDVTAAAGVAIPDTRLAREPTELVRDRTDDLIHHHSRRVYCWGSLQGRNRGLSCDPELLYLGAMFYDLGLNAEFRTTGRRFGVDSADEAQKLHAQPRGAGGQPPSCVDGYRLHTTPGIPEFMEPEVALLTAGVEYDVLGVGYDDVSAGDRAAITALHPRPDFKRRILAAFAEGMASKPETTFGTVNADVLERFVPGLRRINFVETIERSRWPE